LKWFLLNPDLGTLTVPSLGLEASTQPGKISVITTLGHENVVVSFRQKEDALKLIIRQNTPLGLPVEFECEGVIL
jgi:hypothetical protein